MRDGGIDVGGIGIPGVRAEGDGGVSARRPSAGAGAGVDCVRFTTTEIRSRGALPLAPPPVAPDCAAVALHIDGTACVSGAEGKYRLGPGDACILPVGANIMGASATGVRLLHIRFVATQLDAAVAAWRQCIGLRISGDLPHGRAAGDLFRLLHRHAPQLAADCRERLAESAVALLAFWFRESQQVGVERTPADYTRLVAYHRQRIEQFILSRLDDPGLNVPEIAGALRMSRRYVHRLFEVEGGVMQWAMAQRLQACRQEIAARGARTICEVAYGWGFKSASHFTHAFKRHFGNLPSEL
jgi:AraC-like DNA-binding protein